LARTRLRFLLHEIDLPKGTFVIGRGAGCHLTIDDPLISRSHAKITVGEDHITVEDLGSRNGVRVNGRLISGAVPIGDGTRLRVGTQEMVLRRVEDALVAPRRNRSTGFMVHCTSCGVPFSTEDPACPNCGHSDSVEETTTTTEQAWSLELLVETMRRAEALNRKQDLERLLVQAREIVERPGLNMDRRRLDQLAETAVRMAAESGSLEWARWALGLFAKRGIVPRSEVGQRLSSLPPASRLDLTNALVEVVRSAGPDSAAEPADREALELFRALAAGG
jgi:uncharacterized Zn finger protein (UPF0148 family)